MRKYLEIKNFARNLRKEMTDSERLLWQELRNRKLKRSKFVRQHPLIFETRGYFHSFFIADFYCAGAKLVIELDGKIHDFQKEKDFNRDEVIREMGLRIIHFHNEELEDMKTVLKKNS